MEKDALGDRIKRYEAHETQRMFIPLLPIYARIDGRSFSQFTKNFARPFDTIMSNTMVQVTQFLVEETHALLGYTQSDEISLGWHYDDPEQQMLFNGKIFKLTSSLAAMASAKFNQLGLQHWPDLVKRTVPTFDCRIFQLPNKDELANCFVWRELDATKNAISQAARSMFSHKELMNKSGKEMQEMMFKVHKVNFNDYPLSFKRGTYVRRETVVQKLSAEVLNKIPIGKRPVNDEVTRSQIVNLHFPWKLSQIANKVDVVYNQADPIIASEEYTFAAKRKKKKSND